MELEKLSADEQALAEAKKYLEKLQELPFAYRHSCLMSDIKTLVKNEQSAFTNAKYTPLEKIYEYLNPLLKKWGIVLQMSQKIMRNSANDLVSPISYDFVKQKEKNEKTSLVTGIHIETRLRDAVTGDYYSYESEFCASLDDAKMQAIQSSGSNLTYAYRYALRQVFNIPMSEEDPDELKRIAEKEEALKSKRQWLTDTYKKAIERNDIPLRTEIETTMKSTNQESVLSYFQTRPEEILDTRFERIKKFVDSRATNKEGEAHVSSTKKI